MHLAANKSSFVERESPHSNPIPLPAVLPEARCGAALTLRWPDAAAWRSAVPPSSPLASRFAPFSSSRSTSSSLPPVAARMSAV